jgi:cell division protein FtsW
MLRLNPSLKKGDRWFFFLPLLLSVFGLFMIFDASSAAALADFGDKFYYLKHQAIWVLLGMAFFFFFAFFDFHRLKKLALPLLIISLVFLVMVLIPGLGREIYGGRRWLSLGPVGFQPGELVKLTLTLYLATFLEKKKSFWPFLILVGGILALLMLEPDLGTASIVAASAFCLYFTAETSLKEIAGLALLALLAGPLLVITSAYRRQRLLTFLNASWDPQGASYHVRQILIALGSGGLFGRGLGQSRQKFLFLPEVTTDSIFAIIAEEFGFLGAITLIFAFFLLVFRGLKLAVEIQDPFGRLLAAGITVYLGVQVLVNLGAMVTLIPLTGVPLPFISYGGSSLLVSLAGMGILYNISRQKTQ